MIGEYVSIYKKNYRTGEKYLVLKAPSIIEAEQAFDELRKIILSYNKAVIEFQYTYFDDEIAVGEIS